VFEETLNGLMRHKRGHANVFIERNVIELWAARLGFSPPRFIAAGDPGPAGELGQTLATMVLMGEAP